MFPLTVLIGSLASGAPMRRRLPSSLVANPAPRSSVQAAPRPSARSPPCSSLRSPRDAAPVLAERRDDLAPEAGDHGPRVVHHRVDVELVNAEVPQLAEPGPHPLGAAD